MLQQQLTSNKTLKRMLKQIEMTKYMKISGPSYNKLDWLQHYKWDLLQHKQSNYTK